MVGTKRTRRRYAAGAVALVIALFCSLTAKLFVWPATDPVTGAHADAVVVMGGPGPRWDLALELAREHSAPVILLSVASVRWDCPAQSVGGVEVQCFRPDPFSTQGEARYAAAEARRRGWHSLILVSTVPQSTRARLRVKRCFGGSVRVVTAPLSAGSWAYNVMYEWAALAKALVWQRSC